VALWDDKKASSVYFVNVTFLALRKGVVDVGLILTFKICIGKVSNDGKEFDIYN
jgi:hypothetical protein